MVDADTMPDDIALDLDATANEPSVETPVVKPDPVADHLQALHWCRRGDALAARIVQRHEGAEPPVPCVWPSLGRALAGLPSGAEGVGGWRPGAYFLTAGTGVGKTQFAVQSALHAAAHDIPALYLALELDDLGMYARAASVLCATMDEFRGTEWSRANWSEFYNGQRAGVPDAVRARLASLPFFAEEPDAHQWSYEDLDARVAGLRVAAQRHRVERGLPPLAADTPVFVVMDFLQLVGSPATRAREDLRERIGRAAYRARSVARDHNAVVLCLSSIPRDAYDKILITDGVDTPDHNDLVGLGKESGDVEFSADGVLVLCAHRSSDATTSRRVDACVAKLRSGPAGAWCAMTFDGSRFAEVDGTGNDAMGIRDIRNEMKQTGKRRSK